MNRRILILLFLISNSVSALPQKLVTISGVAVNATDGRTYVQITLNDTIRKLGESRSPDYAVRLKDPSCLVAADAQGRFSISGKESDSLYFHSHRYLTKAYRISDLAKLKKPVIRLEREKCITVEPCTDTMPTNFYAFVGEKIKVEASIDKYYCNFISLDLEYAAEYKLVQNVFGTLPSDTVKFAGFSHQGLAFSQSRYALLFVGEYCGKLYHEKYQYFDVYQTTDGGWASPGDPYRFNPGIAKTVKAQDLWFEEPPTFDTRTFGGAGKKPQYSPEYFTIAGSTAIPFRGAYIEDLITVKKQGSIGRKFIRK